MRHLIGKSKIYAVDFQCFFQYIIMLVTALHVWLGLRSVRAKMLLKSNVRETQNGQNYIFPLTGLTEGAALC